MDATVARELKQIRDKINEVERKVENFLLDRHQENKDAIAISEEAVMELAEMVSALTENEEA